MSDARDLPTVKHAPPPRRSDDIAAGRCPVCGGLTRRRYGAALIRACRTGWTTCTPPGGAPT